MSSSGSSHMRTRTPTTAASLLLIGLAVQCDAFSLAPAPTLHRHLRHHYSRRHADVIAQHSKGWDGFGKGPFKYYNDFDAFMSPFPDEDREAYPEMFRLPKGVREVKLPKPLGIAFEEKVPGAGVLVDYLVEGGNAEKSGDIQPGDILILVTAIKVFGPRWERKLLPAIDMPFDVVMGAIGSNEPRYQARDVVMQFMRPSEADEAEVRKFIEFFEVPYDHVFRTG